MTLKSDELLKKALVDEKQHTLKSYQHHLKSQIFFLKRFCLGNNMRKNVFGTMKYSELFRSTFE